MGNENMKAAYIDAEMEIIAFESEDVIAESCTCDSHDEEEDNL